jgi:hypothetical protein
MVCSGLGSKFERAALVDKEGVGETSGQRPDRIFRAERSLPKAGPAEEMHFSSFGAGPKVRNFGGFRFRGFPGFRILAARLKSGPDVFADALV